MGSMDTTTKVGIDALLRELRRWPVGERKATASELAVIFALDPFIVKRIMQSEGFTVDESGVYEKALPTGDTRPIRLDILDED
jgi:hypothetical protein